MFLSKKHSSDAGLDSVELWTRVRHMQRSEAQLELCVGSVRYSHYSSRVLSVNSLDTESVSDAPSSDTSDDSASLQTSLSSVRCEVACSMTGI